MYKRAVSEYLAANASLFKTTLDRGMCGCGKRDCKFCAPFAVAYDRQQLAYQALEALERGECPTSRR